MMASSYDESHLIQRPHRPGFVHSDITGAVAVSDALAFTGSGNSPALGGFKLSGSAAAAAAAAANAHDPLSSSMAMPEWLPSGPFNVGSMGRSFGMSPAGILGTTPPFGKSIDMMGDLGANLMEAAAGEWEGGFRG